MVKFCTSNIALQLGIITTDICNIAPNINAPIKYLFENKSILNIEPSLLILNTCTSSSIPSDTNAIVLPTSKLNLLYPI